jgi:hypothetical protein
MGGLVGGAFATGMDARELETFVTSLDRDQLLLRRSADAVSHRGGGPPVGAANRDAARIARGCDARDHVAAAIFPPIEIDGRVLIDGGTMNNARAGGGCHHRCPAAEGCIARLAACGRSDRGGLSVSGGEARGRAHVFRCGTDLPLILG